MPSSTVAAPPPTIERSQWAWPLARVLALSAASGLLPGSARVVHEARSERAFLGALPVVLSASRLAQPVGEAPSATTVIDRDMIRVAGARSVDELMRWVPGFQVGPRSFLSLRRVL